MSQILTKGLQDNAVTTPKINNGAVTDAKVASGIDAAKLGDGSVSNTEFQRLNGLTGDIQSQLDAKIPLSQKGAANGVASLDGAGKVPVAQLPNAIMEYQGTWNASTNSPSLADGVGSIGDVYRVSVAGTQDLGSGNITFAVGDYAILNASLVWEKADTTDAVASVNGFTGVVVLSTTDIAEGSNLYFTDARARTAVGVPKKETFTLGAGDITNQYIDLTEVAKTDSIHFIVKGLPPLLEGASHDYSVSYTGGAGGKTRITFLNDLATGGAAALVASDVVQVAYTK